MLKAQRSLSRDATRRRSPPFNANCPMSLLSSPTPDRSAPPSYSETKSKNTLPTLTACSSMLALPRLPRLNRNRRNTSMTASTSIGDPRGAFAAFAATLGRRCHRMDSISGAQADFRNALYQANHTGLLAGQLGAPYFIPTLVVPLLLITHGLAFRILRQHQNESAVRESRHPA